MFIYGPAAVGKLTIGRELAKLTGFRLFHNHLTVDAVMAVFDFGSEPFINLREQILLSVFKEAARNNVSLIYTFSPDQDTIDAVEPLGRKVLFIELTCPIEELEQRMKNPSRAEFCKLRSLEVFRKIRQEGLHIYPKLPNSGLTIDTSKMSPIEAAHKIGEVFSLV